MNTNWHINGSSQSVTSEELNTIKELTIIPIRINHTNSPTIQQTTMTSSNIMPLSHLKNEHKMLPCQHCRCMVVYTPGGWGIHKCPPLAFKNLPANSSIPSFPKQAREFDDCHLCSQEVDSTLDGWGIHECSGKLNSQGKPTPVQSAPKKLLPDTPDIWTPSLPWYSPAKVKELNSKIKEQDTIFEMEKIPQYHVKTKKQKINLYKQVPFVVSIHYSN